MKKLKACKGLLLTIIFSLLLGLAAGGLANSATPDTPRQIVLTWSLDPRTTQTISWKTDEQAENSRVQYAEYSTGGFAAMAAANVLADTQLFAGSPEEVWLHRVTLTGLKPGTRYMYRVGSGETWSASYSFKTAPANSNAFEFLVFGDSQSIDYSVWQMTLHNARRTHPNAAFFTNVGDLVDVGQDMAQWNAWFAGGEDVLATLSTMPITGNHETYTPERVFSLPELFVRQFRLPENGPADMRGRVYSFDYGNVHFVMLDSQASEEARLAPDMLKQQRQWLAEDLAAADKPWKLVFLHKPLYNSAMARDNEELRRSLVPVMDQYGVDVVFSGHEHVYARTFPLLQGEVSPLGGTIYVTSGRSGTKTYPKLEAGGWHEFFYNPLEEPIYLTVEMMGDTLTIKAFKQNGEQVDAWTLRHDK